MTDKAYLITMKGFENDDECYEIVSAPTAGQAKYRSELRGEIDWVDLRARRAPAFDGKDLCAQRTYFEAGWLVECSGYGREVDKEETLGDDDAILTPVSVGDRVYCCEACASRMTERKQHAIPVSIG